MDSKVCSLNPGQGEHLHLNKNLIYLESTTRSFERFHLSLPRRGRLVTAEYILPQLLGSVLCDSHSKTKHQVKASYLHLSKQWIPDLLYLI